MLIHQFGRLERAGHSTQVYLVCLTYKTATSKSETSTRLIPPSSPLPSPPHIHPSTHPPTQTDKQTCSTTAARTITPRLRLRQSSKQCLHQTQTQSLPQWDRAWPIGEVSALARRRRNER